VRAGADRAQVEGTFHLNLEARALIEPVLAENGWKATRPEMLSLAREVRRTVAACAASMDEPSR